MMTHAISVLYQHATVCVDVYSCAPPHSRLAVRFGGPQGEWRWVDVPTPSTVTLSRVVHARPPASLSLMENNDANNKREDKEEDESLMYELAFSPVHPDLHSGSIATDISNNIIRLDARCAPGAPVTLRSCHGGINSFQVMVMWSFYVFPSKRRSGHGGNDDNDDNIIQRRTGYNEEEKEEVKEYMGLVAPIHTYTNGSNNKAQQNERQKRRSRAAAAAESLKTHFGSPLVLSLSPSPPFITDEHSSGCMYRRQEMYRGSESAAHSTPAMGSSRQKPPTASNLFLGVPSDRLVLFASFLSLHQRNVAPNRVVKIELVLESSDEVTHPWCGSLLRTMETTRESAAKIAQMGPPCLLPPFTTDIRPDIGNYDDSHHHTHQSEVMKLHLRCSVLETSQRCGSLDRANSLSSSHPRNIDGDVENCICPLGDGSLTLCIPHIWANIHQKGDLHPQWKPHPCVEQTFMAEATLQCGKDEVELAFMFMPLSAYREAFLNYDAVNSNNPLSLEMRLEEIFFLDGNEQGEKEQEYVVGEVWLSHPPIYLDEMPSAREDNTSCRHVSVPLAGSKSLSGVQDIFFPMKLPFARLSFAVMLRTRRDNQEVLYHASVPMDVVRADAWRTLSVSLAAGNNNFKKAPSLRIRYRFGGEHTNMPAHDHPRAPRSVFSLSSSPSSSSPSLCSFTFRLTVPNCHNLLGLMRHHNRHQIDGVTVQAVRIVISDAEDDTARALSRVVDGTELMLCSSHFNEVNFNIVFTRVVFMPEPSMRESNSNTNNNSNNDYDNRHLLLLRCQVLGFTSRAHAEQLHNSSCMSEGFVVLSLGSIISSCGHTKKNTWPVNVHLAMNLNSSNNNSLFIQPSILHISGTVKYTRHEENEGILCIRSLHLLRQPHNTAAVYAIHSIMALCLWFSHGGCGLGSSEWKQEARHFQSVLIQMSGLLQQPFSSGGPVPSNEMILSPRSAEGTLCVALVPYPYKDNSQDVRRTIWKSLKLFAKNTHAYEMESMPRGNNNNNNNNNGKITMNTPNYIEMDLTSSLIPYCSLAGVVCINNILHLSLQGEWVKVPSNALPSSTTLSAPAPRLWALRVLRTNRQEDNSGAAAELLHVKSVPIHEGEESSELQSGYKREATSARKMRLLRECYCESHSRSRSPSAIAENEIHPSRCIHSITVRPSAALPWMIDSQVKVQFIFGDVHTSQTLLSLSVDGQRTQNILMDALVGSGTTRADDNTMIIDWFHGLPHVDQGEGHQRLYSIGRGKYSQFRDSEREGVEGRNEHVETYGNQMEVTQPQRPGHFFVPFMTPLDPPEGVQLHVSYHTLTRCGRDGALLVGGIREGAMPILFYYSFIDSTWSPLTLEVVSGYTPFYRGRSRFFDFTARQGHTAVYCPIRNAVYVYGGLTLGKINARRNKDREKYEMDDRHGSPRRYYSADTLSYLQDVWCVSLSDKTLVRLETVYSAEDYSLLFTARWRHSAAYYDQNMFIAGGKSLCQAKELRKASNNPSYTVGNRNGEDVKEARGGGDEYVEMICSCTHLLTLNLLTHTWTMRSCVGSVSPEPRYGHATATRGARMYMFGGMSASGELLGDLHELDLSHCSWTRIHHSGVTAPPAMHLAALDEVTVNGCPSLVLVGGETIPPSRRMHVFLFSHNTCFWQKIHFASSPGHSRIGAAFCEVTTVKMLQLYRHRKAWRRLPIPNVPHIKLLMIGGEKCGKTICDEHRFCRGKQMRSPCPSYLINLSWDDRAHTPCEDTMRSPQQQQQQQQYISPSPPRAHTHERSRSPSRHIPQYPSRSRKNDMPRRSRRQRTPTPSVLTRQMQDELINRLYYTPLEKQKACNRCSSSQTTNHKGSRSPPRTQTPPARRAATHDRGTEDTFRRMQTYSPARSQQYQSPTSHNVHPPCTKPSENQSNAFKRREHKRPTGNKKRAHQEAKRKTTVLTSKRAPLSSERKNKATRQKKRKLSSTTKKNTSTPPSDIKLQLNDSTNTYKMIVNVIKEQSAEELHQLTQSTDTMGESTTPTVKHAEEQSLPKTNYNSLPDARETVMDVGHEGEPSVPVVQQAAERSLHEPNEQSLPDARETVMDVGHEGEPSVPVVQQAAERSLHEPNEQSLPEARETVMDVGHEGEPSVPVVQQAAERSLHEPNEQSLPEAREKVVHAGCGDVIGGKIGATVFVGSMFSGKEGVDIGCSCCDSEYVVSCFSSGVLEGGATKIPLEGGPAEAGVVGIREGRVDPLNSDGNENCEVDGGKNIVSTSSKQLFGFPFALGGEEAPFVFDINSEREDEGVERNLGNVGKRESVAQGVGMSGDGVKKAVFVDDDFEF